MKCCLFFALVLLVVVNLEAKKITAEQKGKQMQTIGGAAKTGGKGAKPAPAPEPAGEEGAEGAEGAAPHPEAQAADGGEAAEGEEATTECATKKPSKSKASVKGENVQGKQQRVALANGARSLLIDQKDAQKQGFKAGNSGNSKAAAAGKQKQKQSQKVVIDDSR